MSRRSRAYASPAYREILSLRTEHAVSTVVLPEVVDATRRATDVLAEARRNERPVSA